MRVEGSGFRVQGSGFRLAVLEDVDVRSSGLEVYDAVIGVVNLVRPVQRATLQPLNLNPNCEPTNFKP